MTAATVNTRLAPNPAPNVEVVDVTFTASGDTFVSKFAKIDGANFTLKSCSGTAADIKLDYTTTAGTVALTCGASAIRGTLVIYGN